ncbi:MAG: hypothetical protein AAGA35_02930 [Patescibacteria group bacterium]
MAALLLIYNGVTLAWNRYVQAPRYERWLKSGCSPSLDPSIGMSLSDVSILIFLLLIMLGMAVVYVT